MIGLMGCSSTEEFKSITQDEKAKLITVSEPTGKNYRKVTVFVTSVEKRDTPNGSVLLVKGQLPNSCARLLNVSYNLEMNSSVNKTFELQISAWKNRNEMCTQQMMPFTYLIEDLSSKKIKKLEQYRYQNETHPLN